MKESDVDQSLLMGSRELFYFGEIEDERAEAFIKGLRRLVAQSRVKPITIHLSTPGGDCYPMMAMYDAIQAMPVEVTLVGWGRILSAGAVILQAADNRILANGTTVMMHDGFYCFDETDRVTLERWFEHEKGKHGDIGYQILLERMKEADPTLTLNKLKRRCKHDVIYTAEEAVAAGLADGLLEYM